jgi:molybdenum cofactor biosynthesis enzyme MoaA
MHLSDHSCEPVYHVTVTSNFGRAFDKYSGQYDKSALPHVTYPGKFFVLAASELSIGISKAAQLLAKLALPGDRLLVLEARVATALLRPNNETGTGLGRIIDGNVLKVAAVHWVTLAGGLDETTVEEATAIALHCLTPILQPYSALSPRTLSVLPIARACQAACRFCFSESSASLEQRARLADVAGTVKWMGPAAALGADRFVITGGGEPGLLAHDSLVELIEAASQHFATVVLISNGVHLARASEERRAAMLLDYAQAGLTVLALSRHHGNDETNASIMGLNTGTENVLSTWRALRSDGQLLKLRLRLICVLQKDGVATAADIADYLKFAASEGVHEVCFKELYVSTTVESAYHDRPENTWSREHQVPLAHLTETLINLGFKLTSTLPWGSPVYTGTLSPNGEQTASHPLRVAAYTEPSLYWERSHGIARSWNLMSDGTCLASLEDPNSQLTLPTCNTGSPRPQRVIRLAAVSAIPKKCP